VPCSRGTPRFLSRTRDPVCRLQAIEGQQVHFGTERRLRDIDRDGAVQVIPRPFEDRVLFDFDDHVKVARRPAAAARLPFIA